MLKNKIILNHRLFPFHSQNFVLWKKKKKSENFNISENNIISVELDMTLWFFFKKKKEKKGMVSPPYPKLKIV